jgi:hypothetical protein
MRVVIVRLLFGVLPLVPAAFGLVVALLGVVAWIQSPKPPRLLTVVVAFALLGGLAHVWAVVENDRGRTLPEATYHRMLTGTDADADRAARGGENLLRQASFAGLRAWNRVDGGNSDATLTPDGFWTVARINADTGRRNDAIFVFDRVRVLQGPYTLSFQFSHNGVDAAFDVVFRTQARVVRVPATIEALGDGRLHAHATFEARDADLELLRLLDLDRLEGDWSEVSIGRVQLEKGVTPTGFSVGSHDIVANPWRGVVWWFGTAGLVLLVVHGSRWLFARVSRHAIGSAIVVGVVAHAVIAGVEVAGLLAPWPDIAAWFARFGVSSANRASGLTVHPNVLGHLLVANAMLVWVVAGRRTSLLVLIVSFVGILFTGSRTAFLGWCVLCVAWGVGLPHRGARWLALVALVSFTAAVVFTPDQFGRLSSAWNLETRNVVQRVETWQVLWAAVRERPVAGIGTHQTEAYVNLSRRERAGLGDTRHAHNVFLHVLTENGLVGLAALIVLIGGLVRFGGGWSNPAGVLMLVVALVMNLTDLTLFTPGVLYPIVVAMAWGAERRASTYDGGP